MFHFIQTAQLKSVLCGSSRRDPQNYVPFNRSMKGQEMDKDRIEDAARQVKGAIKEAMGKATGDAKLETEGKTDKATGKMQNAVGGFKDALRGK